MDALSKLLNRISLRDKMALLQLMENIKDADARKLLDIKKLSHGDLYRARRGKFRIIFHFKNGKAVTDSVRFRNEKTYRNV